MTDDNIQRDIGRLEGRQDAIENRLNNMAADFDKLEKSLNDKLDKLSDSMLELSSNVMTLNERASSWKLPAGVIFGAGTIMALFLTWLDSKFPGIAKLFK